jgi:hypothetical protein
VCLEVLGAWGLFLQGTGHGKPFLDWLVEGTIV